MSSAEYTTFCPDAKAGEEFEFRSLRKDNKNVSDEQKYAFFIPPRYAFIPIYTFPVPNSDRPDRIDFRIRKIIRNFESWGEFPGTIIRDTAS